MTNIAQLVGTPNLFGGARQVLGALENTLNSSDINRPDLKIDGNLLSKWAEVVILYTSDQLGYPIQLNVPDIKTVRGFNRTMLNLNTKVYDLLERSKKIPRDSSMDEELLNSLDLMDQEGIFGIISEIIDEEIIDEAYLDTDINYTGKKVRIIKANGRGKNEYMHGGNTRTVPFGIYPVVDTIDFGFRSYRDSSIEIRIKNGGTWQLDPSEVEVIGENHKVVDGFELNLDDVLKQNITLSAEWMYINPKIFKFYPRAPPSESQSHVLKLEASNGCPAACTYCTEFLGIEYAYATIDQFKKHTALVEDWLGDKIDNFRRNFFAGADAMSIPYKTLSAMARLTNKKFDPKRIALYSRTQSILEKTGRELNQLDDYGLDVNYWGIETGSDALLKFVNKGCTFDQMMEAGELLSSNYFKSSVMVMPGLGGVRFYKDHVLKTSELLREIKPKWLTLLSIDPKPGSYYTKQIDNDHKNRPLTKLETLEQIRDIILNIHGIDSQVGCYLPTLTPVASNPIELKFKLNRSSERMEAMRELTDKIIVMKYGSDAL